MPVPARTPSSKAPADMQRGGSALPGAASLPPTAMAATQNGGGLGSAARLHDLSSDLRAIHNAMLPSAIHQALNQLASLAAPSADDICQTLGVILDHSGSLLDALMACRLLEGTVDGLMNRSVTPQDQGVAQALRADYEALIAQLAGRLGLGALDSILRADALGRLRGQVRRYRLTRWPARGQPQPPAYVPPPPQTVPAQPDIPDYPQEIPEHNGSPVARGWLRHPLGLPRRNGALSLGAVTMAAVMPLMGAVLIPATPERSGTWAALIAMTAAAAAVAILASPFRWPAARRQPKKPVAPPPPAPPAEASPTQQASDYDLWLHEVRRQGLALTAQGVPVETMDQNALTDWIERSGEDIATLIDKARAQSSAIDQQDPNAQGY